MYNISNNKDQDLNLVPSQPHILHNLTGEAGDTSALAPNLHQTYFEVSLINFSIFILTMISSELRRPSVL